MKGDLRPVEAIQFGPLKVNMITVRKILDKKFAEKRMEAASR